MLKIIPGDEPEIREIGGPLRTGKHRTDGKYKYLGGVLARRGCVYMIPSDADYVLRVNCATDECREVGDSLENEAVVQNKWQNGFIGEDGVMWGIPLKAETVLTIVPTEPGKDPVVKTVGGPFKGLNLWEGGGGERRAETKVLLHAPQPQIRAGDRSVEGKGRRRRRAPKRGDGVDGGDAARLNRETRSPALDGGESVLVACNRNRTVYRSSTATHSRIPHPKSTTRRSMGDVTLWSCSCDWNTSTLTYRNG